MSIPTLAPYTMPTQTIPNKVDWTPEAPRAALLIHDMQDYFLDKYDVQAAPIPDLLDNISRLRAQCDLAGIPVFYTAQPIDQAPADRALLNDFWGPGLTAPQYHARQGITARLAPR
ncbi:MAG: isochorismatase family protein, partial [Alcaligenaceae bacterium]|nr:isochorismatase family protein [Alcaligenaceae bacterium]